MTGYKLAKAFGSSLDFFRHAQSSHIYLELKKLEAKGLIEGETVEPIWSGRGPSRPPLTTTV